MQKLAKDLGHETAFILKPTRSDCDVKFRHSGDRWQSYRVIQGVAMGRPSVIRSEVFAEDNEMRRTRIKGSAIT